MSMTICLSVRMLNILVLCPVLLASVLTLTIDSQLGTSIEDCFERVSIGEQLPSDAIYRNVSELTTKECEQICKQDKQCQTYDYGVGAKGNATCELSKVDEKEIKEKNLLQKHPDYDVYVRRFQCEQSPPSPLQPQSDDPGDGPQHRPVYRPDAEEKRPLAGYPPLDLRPFETNGPRPSPPYGYRPERPSRPFNNYIDNERPDDYENSKPDYDRPPSYGAHKPQDIPYRPERPGYGPHRPQDVPYRPERPHNHTHKPDPYDVLQFQEPYGRPRPPPASLRPDPYYPNRPNDEIQDIYGQKPVKPEIRPEHPQYVYIIRPTRKPLQDQRPQEDTGYGRPPKPDYPRPDSQNDPGHPNGPVGPPNRPYRPRPTYQPPKPNDKPTYSYNEQYASNYADNQDNSIYVQIYDPPRPYRPKPDRPIPQGTFGYGTQSQHYSQSAQSSQYGSSSLSYGQNRPQQDPKPQKPGYGQSDFDSSYGPKPQGTKPSYADQQYPSYGSHDYSSQSAYGESHSSSHYGVSQGSYSQYGTGQKGQGQGQGYGSQDHSQPSYASSDSQYGYGQNQASYGQSHQQYGSSQISQTSYGQSNQYGSQNLGSYGGQTNDQYGSSKPGSYGGQSNDQYGSSKPGSYGGQSNDQYGSSKPGSYGGQSNDQYGSSKPGSYGGQSNDQYGSSKPGSYGGQSNDQYGSQNQGSYGGQSHDQYGSSQSNQQYGQSNQQYGSTSNQGYGGSSNQQYGQSNKGSYGIHSDSGHHYGTSHGSYQYESQSNQNHQVSTSEYNLSNHQTYGQVTSTQYGGHSGSQSSHSYDDDEPSNSYNRPNRPHKPTNQDTGYTNQRPQDQPTSTRPSSQQDSSYGSTQTGKPSNDSGYKPDQTGYDFDRPDYKPVYESDIDKPGDVPSYLVGPNGEIVTSRPVTIGDYEERPGYGRNPGNEPSYKACFRRVLAGRRALRSHVRKVLHCEQLEDCRRECAIEKRFHCESFNYRLDPSFRGKGLCELMTKPIEAFNLHEDFVDDKDYDFYELDRNSLEPHCLDTLRGPGLLHSGYLSSKPSGSERWSDRSDWYEGYRGYKYQDERRVNRYSNRRYEDRFFVPYQIGVSRANTDENWGQYGGTYGSYDSYYKDRNDHHKSMNHWRLADERTYHGVKPYGDNTEFNYHSLAKSRAWDNQVYGNSWKRWGGWDSLEPAKVFIAEGRSDEVPVKDCSSRRRPGMSLGSGAIRRSLFARNVVECEAACFGETEFKCVSYSYRYSSSHGIDNCFLSERPYKGLEMSADSGSDVYAMPQDQGCGTVSKQPWVESECFWHVRSGAAVGGTAVRAALTVAGLGACEAECIRAHAFFCRGFSFRFDSPSIGDDLENCILTSTPPTSLDTGRGLRPTAGHELYARGNYGRGCEPALYDDVHYRDTQCYLKYDNAAKLTGNAVRGQARVKDERACGSACTDAPFRCLSFSFRSTAPPEKENCLLSEIRLFDLQRGVDYEHSADDWLFAFDLFNGQCWRKVHGKEYDVPTLEVPRPLSAPTADEHYPPSGPDLPPPETYIPSGPSGPGFPSAPEDIPKPYIHERPAFKPFAPGPSGPVSKPGYPELPSAPSGPGFRPYLDSDKRPIEYPGHLPPSAPSGPGFRPYLDKPVEPYPSGYDGPKYKPYPDSRPKYKPPPPVYKPGYPPQSRPQPEPGYPGRPNRPIYGDREDNEIIASWRHYTVSGFPCRKGTTCAQNQVAGHWACEPEGGEIGSWDYCCAPTHRCGYSEGFQKPWCYVGPENDQWRPCSEKYYPYHQHKVPHPSQVHRDEIRPHAPSRPHRERPGYGDRVIPGPYLSDADRKYWDELYRNGPQAYYDKYGNPLPGYSRVPTEERPYIKYRQNNPRPGTWLPVNPAQEDLPPGAGELGVPRYWPVAYLHKGPPPNMTYFRYNETSTNNRYPIRDDDPPKERSPESKSRNINKGKGNDLESRTIDDDDNDDIEDEHDNNQRIRNRTDCNRYPITTNKPEVVPTTLKVEIKETTTEVIKEIDDKKENETESKAENVKVDEKYEVLKGIDDKLDDFTTPIEIFDIEDVKPGKLSDLKTVEAEEKQIEAIGRLLASRRGSKLVLEKRSQKDLESKKIALDKDFVDFNFGNKFPTTERRGIIQKVSKDDIEKERFGNDRSLEVSETTFVRPPRVLSTTENIRKAIVNGKVFYDATIRDQRDLFSNSTRKPKSLRLEESRGPSVIANSNAKKKVVRARNINPIRRVRRVYRKRYNPEEVRKRLLERERSKNNTDGFKS
ncbi:uncharacterized protein [Epargyreus clarus]|uniref:uncharacterized protein n=1 Tax=Epargyreus clarus TaxID=520877 RepID=UPI003C2D4B09